ncbi:hypothetical protein [Tautonia plasticadhaerens]|uniref:Uncharacterized protein n=1 Tax=Tautonia plasticadhaerens TaxID=2527974 RepID=A0A518GVU0_9BACT|nr:hypothetical protein [Tautonia plasticadhaerens]QDV32710.1 hypothetical protein ElP_05490 [Tautonia plasticadhaerens]
MRSSLDPRPGPRETIAAAMRLLRLAIDAEDVHAACMASTVLCMKIRNEVEHRLRDEPDWDSKGRWLATFSTANLYRLPPGRVRVFDAMTWGSHSNTAGRLWPEPFETDLRFDQDAAELTAYRIRFGDRRSLPNEGVREGFARTVRDIRDGAVSWRYEWQDGPPITPVDR